MNNSSENKKEYFLATTALEEFWDTSKPIIFLSDACLKHSRKNIWQPLDYKIFESPLKNKEVFLKAFETVDDVYERTLAMLAKSLNELHDISSSLQFWRIVIGPWLMHYTHIVYERYICLKTVLVEYENVSTVCLSENSFVICNNFPEFIERIFTDSYNLQMYSRILSVLGHKFSKRDFIVEHSFNGECYKPIQSNHVKKFIKTILKNYSSIVIKSSHFPTPIAERSLFYKTMGKVFFDHDYSTIIADKAINSRMRSTLEESLKSRNDDEFMKLLLKLIVFDIPRVYIEGFSGIKKKFECSKIPKAIMTSEGWYFDEAFKMWAAHCADNGTVLLGVQHGCDYGIGFLTPLENHEMKIVSTFYSWGWSTEENSEKVKPMPSPRLMSRREIVADNSKEGILLVINCYPRYFYRFQDVRSYDAKSYFVWQKRFLESLSTDNFNKLRLRLFPFDYGNETKLNFLCFNEEITFDNIDMPFVTSLTDCRISVYDCLEGSFFESLVFNKPTVLFWNPDVYMIRASASAYFKKLKKAGILYYNPEDAAQALTDIYQDTEGWWLDPLRQNTRNEFCGAFAKTSSDDIGSWADEFKRILSTNN